MVQQASSVAISSFYTCTTISKSIRRIAFTFPRSSHCQSLVLFIVADCNQQTLPNQRFFLRNDNFIDLTFFVSFSELSLIHKILRIC